MTAHGRERPVDLTVPSGGDRQFPIMPIRVAGKTTWDRGFEAGVASKLESQGETVLGGHVRYFAMHLPPVLTDRERLAEQFVRFVKAQRSARTLGDDRVRGRSFERSQ